MSGLRNLRLLRAIAWVLIKRWIHLQFPTVATLSTSELAAWLEQPSRQPPLLLDARSEAEFAVSHLPAARPAWTLAAQPIDPTTPIVVYCAIGYRSARLAEQLQAQGYRNVFNLEGSIFQWANEGRSVYQQDRAVQQVHPYNSRWGLLLDPGLSMAQSDPPIR